MTVLTPPATLSPTKIAAFKDCPLAFRYSAIDRLLSVPSAEAVRGNLVHRALEILHAEIPAGYRGVPAAAECLDRAWREAQSSQEFIDLTAGLDFNEARTVLYHDAYSVLLRYYELEDPDTVRAVGFETMVSMPLADGVVVRGIIDRLDLGPDGFVVVDYKTGKTPPEHREAARMAGVNLYAALVEHVVGVRPHAVRLMYLRDAVTITGYPSDQSSRAVVKQAAAVWAAIERACERNDFRPRPGPLCGWCSFKDRCPAWGGAG